MIYGLDAADLREGWTPLEAVAVVKCLDDRGRPQLSIRVTHDLTLWESVGMLQAAHDVGHAADIHVEGAQAADVPGEREGGAFGRVEQPDDGGDTG